MYDHPTLNEPAIRAILAQEYPRFSDAEYDRRRQLLAALMAKHKSRPAGPLPDMVLEENMTVVVQPNVVTKDQKAGLQLGDLVRITRTGCVSMQSTPHGFMRLQ